MEAPEAQPVEVEAEPQSEPVILPWYGSRNVITAAGVALIRPAGTRPTRPHLRRNFSTTAPLCSPSAAYLSRKQHRHWQKGGTARDDWFVTGRALDTPKPSGPLSRLVPA